MQLRMPETPTDAAHQHTVASLMCVGRQQVEAAGERNRLPGFTSHVASVHEGYSPRLIDNPLFASLHVDVVARSDTLMVPEISLNRIPTISRRHREPQFMRARNGG